MGGAGGGGAGGEVSPEFHSKQTSRLDLGTLEVMESTWLDTPTVPETLDTYGPNMLVRVDSFEPQTL